jgi:hypothetical protein
MKERVEMRIHRARKQGKALGRLRVEVDPPQVAGLRARSPGIRSRGLFARQTLDRFRFKFKGGNPDKSFDES